MTSLEHAAGHAIVHLVQKPHVVKGAAVAALPIVKTVGAAAVSAAPVVLPLVIAGGIIYWLAK